MRHTAGALLVTLLLAGCGVMPQRSPEQIPGERLPVSPSATSAPSTTSTFVPVWVCSDEALVRVNVAVPDGGLQARLNAMLDASRLAPGLRVPIPAGTRLLGVSRDGRLLSVDLSEQMLRARGADKQAALAQLVFTVTEIPSIDLVRITAGGQPMAMPGEAGRLVRGPLSRADFTTADGQARTCGQ